MRVTWGSVSERRFETGVDRGMLYVGTAAVPWNGLTNVIEKPSGGTPTSYYLDGVKYLARSSVEEFQGTIEALTYPDEFAECDGSAQLAYGLFITQQARTTFGFSYRTLIGDAAVGTDRAYKIHIVYNAMATPTQRSFRAVNENPELASFSWDISTTHVKVVDNQPLSGAVARETYGSHFVVDTRLCTPAAAAGLEDILYGSATTDPRLPTPEELLQVFTDYAVLKITDNGDGTFTADGPVSAFSMIDDSTIEFHWDSVVQVSSDIFKISSF